MPSMTLRQFANHMTMAAFTAPMRERAALGDAADRMAAVARGYLGHYNSSVGPYGPWPPLAPSTLADKARKGLPSPSPLVRTGTLRISIDGSAQGRSAVIGSGQDVALYQEMGTRTIPPRPFLGRAVAARGRVEAQRVAHAIFRPLLTGRL